MSRSKASALSPPIARPSQGSSASAGLKASSSRSRTRTGAELPAPGLASTKQSAEQQSCDYRYRHRRERILGNIAGGSTQQLLFGSGQALAFLRQPVGGRRGSI